MQSLVPDIPPEVISATWSLASQIMTLTFNTEMLAAVVNLTLVTLSIATFHRSVSFMYWENSNTMVCNTAQLAPYVGPPITSSNGAELLILSSVGLSCEAWTDFPVTAIP